MNPIPISNLDKAALITTGAAAAFKVLLWSLSLSLTSSDPAVGVLRVVFAVLSFVAFDLVLYAVVVDQRRYGRSGWSLLAAAGAAVVSALIALDVARVWPLDGLHAAPAIMLLLFVLHLVLPHRTLPQGDASGTAPPQQVTPAITQAVQVNVAASALPATIPAYIIARAAELPHLSAPALATELGTSADTVRRALAKSIEEEAVS